MVVAPAQHRPLAGLALATVAGTLLGLCLPGPAALSGVYALVSAGLLAAWFATHRRRGALLLLAALCAAAANGAFRTARERMRFDELLRIHESRTQVALTGTLLTEPDGAALPHGGARLSFRFRVDSAADADGAALPFPRRLLPMPLDVDFYAPESYLGESPSRAVPRAGEGWTFTGKIRARAVPYQSAPVLSLRATVSEPHQRVSQADAPRWRQALWDVRRATARRLALGIGDRPRDVAILRAVLLGYRSNVPDEVRDLFANSGTVHFFAISGLHILLVARMLLWALRRSGMPRRAQGLVLVPALAAYTVLTGGRPSAERACIMTSLFCAGPVFQRRPDAISSVAAAAVALLWMDPSQLGDIGFVFSFSSVLGILLLAPPLKSAAHALFRKKEPEPGDEAAELVGRMVAARPGGDGPRPCLFVRCLSDAAVWCLGLPGMLGRRALSALPVSVAAWAVAEPITARVFGQMVPVSILSNLVIIPIGEATVVCAATGLLAGCVSPALAVPFNWVAATLVDAMVWTTGVFARLPGGHFDVEPWSGAAVAAWYAAVLLVAFLLRIAMERNREE